MMFTLIAHRGASKEAPENTLASFQKALEIGVHYIEFDVHVTRDGVPIVLHDSLLGRTTGSRHLERVTDLDWSEMSTLDAGSWFGKEFAGQRIPVLDEVLQLQLNNEQTGLMIEIKKGHAHIAPLVTSILASVHRANCKNVVLGSFSIHALEEIRHRAPQLQLIGIVDNSNMIDKCRAMKLPRMAMWYKLLNPSLVQSLHEEGTEVWAYTVDDPKVVKFLLSIGVDGIITNDPRSFHDAAFAST